MNRVVKILMKRDGMTEKEAKEQVADVSEQIQVALLNGWIDEVEDIMMDELGLEMDYIEDVLGI